MVPPRQWKAKISRYCRLLSYPSGILRMNDLLLPLLWMVYVPLRSVGDLPHPAVAAATAAGAAADEAGGHERPPRPAPPP